MLRNLLAYALFAASWLIVQLDEAFGYGYCELCGAKVPRPHKDRRCAHCFAERGGWK
jgi:hypothetical protein